VIAPSHRYRPIKNGDDWNFAGGPERAGIDAATPHGWRSVDRPDGAVLGAGAARGFASAHAAKSCRT
jgi:hypothetical protein